MSNNRIVLYAYGIFDTGKQSEWPALPVYAGQIVSSLFNVVVLSAFAVDGLGDLFGREPLVVGGVFNPAGKLDPNLQQYCQLMSGGGRKLYYSIGNRSGTIYDFPMLEGILSDPTGSAYANLQNNLTVLKQQLGLTGVDFNFQPHGPGSYSSAQQTVVAQFTTFCNQLGLEVTYCPYTNQSWWIGAQTAAVTAGGKVAWWNLQCYGLGTANTPATWLPLIQQNATAMGVADPATFLVPGLAADLDTQQVIATLTQFAEAAPGLDGAFIWQLGDIAAQGSPPASFAGAIIEGLGLSP